MITNQFYRYISVPPPTALTCKDAVFDKSIKAIFNWQIIYSDRLVLRIVTDDGTNCHSAIIFGHWDFQSVRGLMATTEMLNGELQCCYNDGSEVKKFGNGKKTIKSKKITSLEGHYS